MDVHLGCHVTTRPETHGTVEVFMPFWTKEKRRVGQGSEISKDSDSLQVA